jgi:hypothetical protein
LFYDGAQRQKADVIVDMSRLQVEVEGAIRKALVSPQW